MLTIILAISCALIILIQYHWSRREIYKLSWTLSGPPALPLLGNALTCFCKEEDILGRLDAIVTKYSNPMRFWFGSKCVVVFKDLNQVEKILSSTKFVNKDPIYDYIKVFNGEGLITSSGNKWRVDRKLLFPLFVNKNIVCYFDNCLKHSRVLIEKLKSEANRSTFDVKIYLHRCLVDIIHEIILGVETKAQNGGMDDYLHNISRAYTIIYARIMKVWLQFDFIFNLTQLSKEQKLIKQQAYDFMRKALRQAQEASKNRPTSILKDMLELKKLNENFATTEEDLLGHLVTFFTASEDTVTTACGFALVMLGMHPESQEKVVKEIDEVVKQNISFGDLDRLKYLDMCIKETIRLFPLAPFLVRYALEDVQIDKWLIPKKCSVVVPIFNLHRDPNYWEKPNQFYPEHFLPETASKRHPCAYCPFSFGPRNCIGKPIALMCMKTVLALILQNYRIEADGTIEDKPIKTDISVRFKDGLYPIRIKLREK